MYTQTWIKYLPIIRILLKRSINGPQVFDLNVHDFEKIGATRKNGYKFNIEFSNCRVINVISSMPMAKELSVVLLEDKVVREIFTLNDYNISMNTKFQLIIKCIPKPVAEAENANAAKHADKAAL